MTVVPCRRLNMQVSIALTRPMTWLIAVAVAFTSLSPKLRTRRLKIRCIRGGTVVASSRQSNRVLVPSMGKRPGRLGLCRVNLVTGLGSSD